jgi:hypothetical protein
VPNQTEHNLPLLVFLASLRAEGVERVVLRYNGQDDDGGIESIECEPDVRTLDPEEQERIDDWARAHAIPHVDWWNNAGGYGTVTFDLATMQAHAEHTQRAENMAAQYGDEDYYVDGRKYDQTVEVQ